ncbi:hypothetical protein AMATHDRAFT_9200 [Amanita thiersii Skay4041]|uniref:Zinc finger C3HC4 RING-type domain-containing protein n=1 Tax=Amanita thiersii Skay4041 TaxID=703135 RepID=A0A2A9N7J0_9AGAR|nr:hypothetical protein AMATHDRAFT_9200 [Amanita thiersii Skay4041]
MGGGGSKISDLFYPDNPKRRARASQLHDDVNFFANQFEEVKKKRNDILQEIKPKLSALMKKYGYNTPEELDDAVQKVLRGKALEDYTRIKQQMDKSDEAITAVFQITSVIGAVTGIFLGGVVILGIMTGGAALAALGVIGAILAVVVVVAVLFSIWEGAQERANMRKAINDLSIERVKARAAYEAMNALANWAYNIKLWLDEPLISDNEELMRKKLEGDFATDYNKSKRSAVVPFLLKYDRDRGAWTNEDPNWQSGPDNIIAPTTASRFSSTHYFSNQGEYHVDTTLRPTAKAAPASGGHEFPPDDPPIIKFDYNSTDGSGSLELMFSFSDEISSRGLDPNHNPWVILYESGRGLDPNNPNVADYFFTLEPTLDVLNAPSTHHQRTRETQEVERGRPVRTSRTNKTKVYHKPMLGAAAEAFAASTSSSSSTAPPPQPTPMPPPTTSTRPPTGTTTGRKRKRRTGAVTSPRRSKRLHPDPSSSLYAHDEEEEGEEEEEEEGEVPSHMDSDGEGEEEPNNGFIGGSAVPHHFSHPGNNVRGPTTITAARAPGLPPPASATTSTLSFSLSLSSIPSPTASIRYSHSPTPPPQTQTQTLHSDPDSQYQSQPQTQTEKTQQPQQPDPLCDYTCPICFAPPSNPTLTPCGHICCGLCLFTAVKTTLARGTIAFSHAQYVVPPYKVGTVEEGA